MRRPDLQLNLFEVPLTDKPFPLFARSPAGDEKLRPDEREWHKQGDLSRKCVLVAAAASKPEYVQEAVSAKDLPPFLVERLLENGLRTALQAGGKDVESSLTSLVAFDPQDAVKTSESFLELRKGIEFISDHVSIERRFHFGFFASLKVRLRFLVDLSDPNLARAATNQKVFVDQGSSQRRMRLLSVDQGLNMATVFNEDEEEEFSIPIANVHVPANRTILVSYCDSLGKRALASQLISQSQEASFRINKNGTKNRAWLKNEMDFVRSWLLRASSGGRLVFSIPNTNQDVFLSAAPAIVRFTEL